jgi:hypothetical protein
MDEIEHAMQTTILQMARTRQMVEDQLMLINRLREWEMPTETAERTLEAFMGTLEILEDHERYLQDEIAMRAEARAQRLKSSGWREQRPE